MQQSMLNATYPDSVNFPERFFETFDYENKTKTVSQQDVDFLIRKDDKIIFIESKSPGGRVSQSQRTTMELIASDENKFYVVCRHSNDVTTGTIPMLEKAWENQIVEECWYKGEWFPYAGQNVTLKDFVNEVFKYWGYEEPVVT